MFPALYILYGSAIATFLIIHFIWQSRIPRDKCIIGKYIGGASLYATATALFGIASCGTLADLIWLRVIRTLKHKDGIGVSLRVEGEAISELIGPWNRVKHET